MPNNDIPVINIYGTLIDYESLYNSNDSQHIDIKIFISVDINETIKYLKENRKKECDLDRNGIYSVMTPFNMVSSTLYYTYRHVSDFDATKSPSGLEIYDAILNFYNDNNFISLKKLDGDDVLCLNYVVDGQNNKYGLFEEKQKFNIKIITLEEAYIQLAKKI